jgi:hypothetical protein
LKLLPQNIDEPIQSLAGFLLRKLMRYFNVEFRHNGSGRLDDTTGWHALSDLQKGVV